MKKNILSELNRVREIMGLKVLLEQSKYETSDDSSTRREKKDEQKTKTELDFFTSKNNKFKSLLQDWKDGLWKIAQEYNFPFTNEDSFADNLMFAIGGANKEFDSIYRKIFIKAQTDWRYLMTILDGDYLTIWDTEEVPIRLMQTTGNKVYVRYTDSDGEETEDLTPSQLCAKLNKKNQDSLGQTQITGIRFPGKGNMNKGIRTNKKDGLCLYSPSKIKTTYKDAVKVTQAAIEGSPEVVSAEGTPIRGGDAFEVYEVAPDMDVVENIVSQIKQGAGEGMEVVDVSINGVASTLKVREDKINTWKKNVGSPYNTWSNEKILNVDADGDKIIEDGAFTEPVTGNQVLAYLRAQNLGKALEEAGGINVTNYTYSVGGDDMKVDVIISQEVPGKEAVADVAAVTLPSGEVENVKVKFSGDIYKVTIDFPVNYKEQYKSVKRDEDLKDLAKAMIARNTVLSYE